MRQSPTFTPSSPRSPLSPRRQTIVVNDPETHFRDRLEDFLIYNPNASLRAIVASLDDFKTKLIREGYDAVKTETAFDRVLDEYFPRQIAVQRANLSVLRSPQVAQSSVQTYLPSLTPSRGIGMRQDASKAEIDERVANTNGFQAKNLGGFLASAVTNYDFPGSPRREITPIIQEFLSQRQGRPLTTEELMRFKQDLSRAAQIDPSRVHAWFVSLAQFTGLEDLREILWRSLSIVSLGNLLVGFGIHRPAGSDGRRHWFHDPNQQRVVEPADGEEFSRYAYDQLFDQYVRHGDKGDRYPPDADRRRERR